MVFSRSKLTVGFTLFFVVHAYCLYAQDDDTYRIKGNQEIYEALPKAAQYRYETFQSGTVSFYNGKSSSGKLNYNILLDDVQFVDRARDTLSIANPETIKQVRIGDDTFYYDVEHGYVEVLEEYLGVKLALHQEFIPRNRENTGAFDQATETSSVRNYTALNTTGGMNKLTVKGDLLISQKATYLLLDKNQRVVRLNRNGVLRVFKPEKKKINAYIKENNINFNRLEDIKTLLEFCSEAMSET